MVNRAIVTKALAVHTFSGSDLSTKLVGILSRYGCHEMPSPQNISQLLQKVASFEFINRLFAAVTVMNGGIPPEHQSFWQRKSIQDLQRLYVALSVSPSKLLEKLEEPLVFDNPNEERVFRYLLHYIGSMKTDEV